MTISIKRTEQLLKESQLINPDLQIAINLYDIKFIKRRREGLEVDPLQAEVGEYEFDVILYDLKRESDMTITIRVNKGSRTKGIGKNEEE